MFILLITVLGLMLWSMRLMMSAFRQRDFSLLFAGTLVALSSAGIVTAYSLMDGCMGYLSAPDDAPDFVASGTLNRNIATEQRSVYEQSQGSSPWIEEVPLIDLES